MTASLYRIRKRSRVANAVVGNAQSIALVKVDQIRHGFVSKKSSDVVGDHLAARIRIDQRSDMGGDEHFRMIPKGR